MGCKLIDLPMKLLMPPSLSNVTEIAFKTIPSVSKIEIKNVLESMYGFEVEKVRTLNMQGKKKRRGGRLVSRPNYKKAYVTLKKPITIAHHLCSSAHALDASTTVKQSANKQLKLNYLPKEDGVEYLRLDNNDFQQLNHQKQLTQVGKSDIFAIGTMGKQSHIAAGVFQDSLLLKK